MMENSLTKSLYLKFIIKFLFFWVLVIPLILFPSNKFKTVENTNKTITQPTQTFDTAKVVRAIDGDTIEIEGGAKVRYIGMDTPEKEKCYFYESTKRNKELTEGKIVKLEKDISETDRYGRLLRYVYIDDLLINEALVKEGFAQAVTFPPDVKYKNKFLEAQKMARENKVGFWLNCQKN